MAIIDNDYNICTLINVFTVKPEKHLELFELLKKATLEVMCKMHGYISANLHISDDKTTVTNYAQWASLEDFKKTLQHPEAQAHMKKAAELAIEFKPMTYDFVWCD